MSAHGLERLAWDTGFFGFPVGRIAAAGRDALLAALREARASELELLYWGTERAEPPLDVRPHGWLATHADHKVVYRCDLTADPPGLPSAAELEVVEWPEGAPGKALLELALVAGEQSRFRLDPRIPEDRFVALYHTWMTRSTRREIAQVVRVALAEGEPAGVATAAIEGDEARIGLFAVRPEQRGRGLADGLLAGIGEAVRARGARRLTVVTQGQSAPARRCYERGGYALASETWLHHLWREGGGG